MFFVGENLWAKGAQKLFRQVWGNSGKNPSHPQNLPVPTPMWQGFCNVRNSCWRSTQNERSKSKIIACPCGIHSVKLAGVHAVW